MSRASLFLTHRLPFPPNRGDKIRAYALLRHLASRGPVRVGCFVDDPEDHKFLDEVRVLAGGDCYFEDLSPLAKRTRSVMALLKNQSVTSACYASARLQAWVDNSLQNSAIDDIVVFGSAMAPFLMRAPIDGRRVLFDMVDVDSDKWRQYAAEARGPARWLYAREARVLEGLEREAAASFGATFLSSPFEAETFRAIAPESAHKIDSFANGVDARLFAAGAFADPFGARRNRIVMTGRMDYRPNYAGAEWFAGQVMPLILKSVPDAQVYFVGAKPPRSLRDLAGPNITVTASVPDIRPYIQHASVVIAPLLMARGVQNKVLEAMAMGKPVVATWQASRALDVRNGIDLWIENDPARFAAAVVAAMVEPEREAMAQNARRFVETHHDWDHTLAGLDARLDDLRGVPASGSAPVRSVPAERAGAILTPASYRQGGSS